ncbi:hypothetical protein NA57DRAFT_62378 [Rhizodiscina lignyota]|uniref:Uncharacterized protein n=1 Tax=Rhizodiscina lignyota TaxID=1504668 RepID=A0A9P4I2X1_9PEZI|nr:hypothetical protein NA57DRAFT_62378 [Rhizodiscina lignyota]
MSDPNIYVSNGTCYTAPGKKLDGSFIPCGNDAFGHQTCCGAGDNCIADKACFGFHGSGYGSYLTYFAGCTDPSYQDASCPKKDVDQPWVALTLCDNSNGEWAICSQKGDPSTLQPGAYCSCTVASKATVAFSDSTSLTNFCSLPQSTGQSIKFLDGNTPTSPTTSKSAASQTAASQTAASQSAASQSAASQSSAPQKSPGSPSTSADDSSSNAPSSAAATSGPSSTNAASTNPGSASVTVFTSSGNTVTASISPIDSGSASVMFFTSSGKTVTSSIPASTTGGTGAHTSGTTSPGGGANSGLGVGAKVGIIVGAVVGGLILLAIIFFLLRRRRRRRSPSEFESGDSGKDTRPPKPDSSEEHPASATSTTPIVRDANGQLMAEADGRAARPWMLRSELEGSPVKRTEELSPIAELPGSENFAGEQGADRSLTQEAHRQLGPVWRGQSLKLLNDNNVGPVEKE